MRYEKIQNVNSKRSNRIGKFCNMYINWTIADRFDRVVLLCSGYICHSSYSARLVSECISYFPYREVVNNEINVNVVFFFFFSLFFLCLSACWSTMKEGEAISFVAAASKLAAVEDAASKGPEASIRSKVSPKARAALQALRSPRNRISTPLTPPPTTTKDVETITG